MFFFISISVLIALLVALFQYKPWNKSRKVYWVLTTFRTFSITVILLLIFNVNYIQNSYSKIKPKLIVLIDNSQSISFLNKVDDVKEILNSIEKNDNLNSKYDIEFFSFGNDIKLLDSLTFSESQTDISRSINSVNNLFKNEVSPILLISDGNQTFGESYAYNYGNKKNIFPVILGDTIKNIDLEIRNINLNKYTFLNNDFPVEIFLNYNGTEQVESDFSISLNNKDVFNKRIIFSKSNSSMNFTTYLNSDKVGVTKLKAKLKVLNGEINTSNNTKNFAIEVIDQKLNIAIVSGISHPDLSFYKSIFKNKKDINVDILLPTEFTQNANKYQTAIVYQPNKNFKSVFDSLDKYSINSFIVVSANTNLDFVNSKLNFFKHELTSKNEFAQAIANTSFDVITLSKVNFINYPPLKTNFGDIELNGNTQVILSKIINGIKTSKPLLIVRNNSFTLRQVIFLAEDVWKWRTHCFKENLSFDEIDLYFQSIFQYLSTKKLSDRIQVSHELIYDGTIPILLKAKFYDENFKLNFSNSFNVEISSNEIEDSFFYEMDLKNETYQVNLDDLNPGSYKYIISSSDKRYSKRGKFDVLPFNAESQFLNSNYLGLKMLAKYSNGLAFTYDNFDVLIKELVKNEQYINVVNLEKKSLPLIDSKYFLILFFISLSIEWFLRKYIGLK